MSTFRQADINAVRQSLTKSLVDWLETQQVEEWYGNFGVMGHNLEAQMAEVALTVLLAVHDTNVYIEESQED